MRGHATNLDAIDLLKQSYRDHTGDSSADIMSLTAEQAKQFLADAERDAGTPSAKSIPEEIMNFMNRLSGRVDSTTYGEGAGEQAFAALNRSRIVSELEEKAKEISDTLLSTSTAGTKALGEELKQAAENFGMSSLVSKARNPYKRVAESFKNGALKELFSNPVSKQVGAAALMTIAGSFMYQSKKKKDFTKGDVSGPPMMPGGNPYETNYPTRQAITQQVQANNQEGQMQYQVNTSGSPQDIERLRGLIGGVSDAQINSTMYNGLPRLGQDPYSRVASSF